MVFSNNELSVFVTCYAEKWWTGNQIGDVSLINSARYHDTLMLALQEMQRKMNDIIMLV